MTKNRENVIIEIIIAGEPIKLTVPFSRQDNVRSCEREINSLYSEWRSLFPKKTPTELLAMIAYQYASYYRELSERYDSLTESLRFTSGSLDEILNNGPETPEK